jgi:hypothetical protein
MKPTEDTREVKARKTSKFTYTTQFPEKFTIKMLHILAIFSA